MSSAEWWVFRVLAPATIRRGLFTPDVPAEERARRMEVLRGVAQGRYHVIGDDICEAVECFASGDDDADRAHATERAADEHRRTGHVHKVTLNLEL